MYSTKNQTLKGGGALSIDIETASIKIKSYFSRHPYLYDDYHKSALGMYVLLNKFGFTITDIAACYNVCRSTVSSRIYVISQKISKVNRFKKEVEKIYRYIIYNANLIYGISR